MDRPLTEVEARVLEWMLNANAGDAEKYRAQVPALRVRGMCKCGCPTINFIDGPLGAPLPVYARVAGRASQVLLFVKDGQLASLEYTSYDEASPASFPSPDDLTLER